MILVAAQGAVSPGGKHVLCPNFTDSVAWEPRDCTVIFAGKVKRPQSWAFNKYANNWEHAG